MTISAIKKSLVLCLAACLFLSLFHEVSCQVEGSIDLSNRDISTDYREYQANVEEQEEDEVKSTNRENESESSWDKNTTVTNRKKVSVSLSEENIEDSFDVDNSILSEAGRGDLDEVGQKSSMMDEINREIEAHLDGLNKQAGSDGVNKVGESTAAVGIDAERRKQLEEIEEQLKAAAATKIVVEGITNRNSNVETNETEFEAEKRQQITSKAEKIEREYKGASDASMESRHRYSASGMLGSLGIPQSGAWRCYNQDQNGVKEEEGASIVIPKYDIDAIIKEESTYQGSASKTSSLIASLTQIVEKHRKEKSSSGVTTGTSSTQSSETQEKIKETLKKYRGISARELVARSDFEEILTTASRYEELSSASVSYISRLSMYGSVVKEGIKASKRVQLAQTRVKLHKDMADEKQKNVDAEFALVKSLAERGDLLYVKIYAIKKLVLKLKAEKEEVDLSFQKTVGNLSRVLEEASQAYEEYHRVVRKWKEEQAAEEFSREAIQSAEEVWVKFLGTL